MATISYTSQIVTTNCYLCGVTFGMEKSFYDDRVQDHKGFFCPNGHSQHFTSESNADRLQRELQAQKDQTAREKHWREQAEARVADVRKEKEHVEARLRGTKSVVTRMKRRTAAGRCTCCSRQFKDLERHMKNEHPNWNPDKAADAMAAKS